MFCPSCGTEVTNQTKYCTKCGLDLRRVKGVMAKGGAYYSWNNQVDWEQLALEDELLKRKRSPEEKRFTEIKGGIITSCVGLGVLIFLTFLFDAIANSIPEGSAREILRAIPFVGVIPFLVGLGILINGLFVSKRIVELKRLDHQSNKIPSFPSAPETAPVHQLPEASQAPISDFSITESTTTKLREPVPVSTPRDTK